MVQEEEESTTWLQHPGDLGDGRIDVLDVLEHEARHRDVERCVAEGQRGSTTPKVRRAAAAAPSHLDLVPRRVDSDDTSAEACGQARNLPLTGSDVQDPPRPAQMGGREREDLLLVLWIDAFGEACLPPVRVLLPEVVGHPRMQHVAPSASQYTPSVTVGRRLSTRDVVLALVVPVVLTLIGLNLVARYHSVHQSPWRGHGFGMYATYEGVPGRTIRVTSWTDGEAERIGVPPEAAHLVSKILVAPGDPETRELARRILATSHADRIVVEVVALTADGGDEALTFGLRRLARVVVP